MTTKEKATLRNVAMRKLLGWAQANANTVANAIMVLLLATILVWQGVAL
jgi:hypothetical protein